MSKWINTWLMGITVFCLVIIGYLAFVPPEAPLIYTGGDAVHPEKVKPGEWINVTRHYRVTREEKLVIVRRMRKGDCHTGCTLVDLLPSNIIVKPGEYVGTRGLQVPASVSTGQWFLEFQIHWEDRIGRTQIIYSPVLSLEIA